MNTFIPEEFKRSMDFDSTNRNELKEYIKEVEKLPLLSSKEQAILIDKYKNGDTSVYSDIISANLARVVSYAKKFSGYGVDLFDLIQEGNLALMKILDNYVKNDASYSFVTCVDLRLKRYLYYYLAKNISMMELPTGVLSELYKVSNVRKQIGSTYNRRANVYDVAKEMAMPISKAKLLCGLLDVKDGKSLEVLQAENMTSPSNYYNPIDKVESEIWAKELLQKYVESGILTDFQCNALLDLVKGKPAREIWTREILQKYVKSGILTDFQSKVLFESFNGKSAREISSMLGKTFPVVMRAERTGYFKTHSYPSASRFLRD